MKVYQLILENFRGFYRSVKISLDDFTVFIGKNDQGKSTILEAMDIFINEGKGIVRIDEGDLNQIAKIEQIDTFRIGVIFKDLPNEIIIDSTNSTTLNDEYLLNKDGFLEIWKSFRAGKLKETVIKCNHPANDDFLKDIMKKKIKELKEFIREKNINVTDVDQRKSAELRKTIRDYYKNKDGQLILKELEIKIDDEAMKEIWPKLQNYLPVYTLFHSDRKNIDQDEEIQDPLKAKVEQIFRRIDIQDKLTEIANEIDKELRDIAQSTVDKFKDLTESSIPVNIIPDIPEVTSLKWKDVYKNISFKTDNDIPLNKRGSGVRRIALVSSFLAEVERKHNLNQNHLIYAIEEPESSLHPDLQIKLINALISLSKSGNHQVFISTHSPSLIRLFEIETIRYVEIDGKSVRVQEWSDSVADKIINSMGLLPHIGKVVICVEGKYDEKFLININKNISELNQIIDLENAINSGRLAIILMQGSNLIDWINRYALKNTNVVEFHLYDRDCDEKYKKEIKKVNQRQDGSSGLLTKKREIENYIPKELIEKKFGIIFDNIDDNNWDNLDIPKKINEKKPELREKYIKERLCCECSKEIRKEHLEKLNAWDEVLDWFKRIKDIYEKALSN